MKVKKLHELNGQKIIIPLHKVRSIEKCVIDQEVVDNSNYCGISFINFKIFSTNSGTRIHFIEKFYCSTNNGYIITFGKQIFDMIEEYFLQNKNVSFVEINVRSKMVDSPIGPLPNYDECFVSNTYISYEVDEELEKYFDSINQNYWHKNQKFINKLSEIGFDVSKVVSQKREESIDSVLKN